MSFFIFLGTEDWHTSGRLDLFLYLPVNRMFVTTGTEFSQFQSTRRIMSILLSNISVNAHWFLINTISNTTGTFQNHRYSDIFTLGHEPPLVFDSFNSLIFRSETRKKKGTKKKKKQVTRNRIMKERFRCNKSI